MIELTDQGNEIEVTAPLHSREWCEAVWPALIKDVRAYEKDWAFYKGMRAADLMEERAWKIRALDMIEWCATTVSKRRISPNSEQFNGIMANCSEEFREAVRSKMNG